MSPEALSLLQPLTAVLPLEQAMGELTPSKRQSAEVIEVASQLASELGDRPGLEAGVWLYVDDLERSHAISQSLLTLEGSLWHAIMHRRESDFGNSKYWLRQAYDVGLLESVYGDAYSFVDRVQREHRQNPLELVALQRKEWAVLFDHCLSGIRIGVA